MKHPVSARLRALLLLAPVALGVGLAGCGGGNSSLNNNANSGLASANAVALTTNKQLLRFNTQTPNTVSSVAITGVNASQTLVGIDYRYTLGTAAAPAAAGATPGLYALGQDGELLQLYRIDTTTGAATTVGTAFNVQPALASIGFDFNPAVDRIRVVDSQGQNLRLNPDTGTIVDGDATIAGTQGDRPLAYDTGDSGNGTTPSVVGAAYTNNTQNTSSTVNYAIDVARGYLVTQGRPANAAVAGDVAVSPNTGRLFSVGSLGLTTSNSLLGFDIATSGATNTGFVALSTSGSQSRLYSVNLANGATTGGARIGSGQQIVGFAIVP